LEHIALLPSVISRLAALDLNSPTATEDIVALIRRDPPLALRLLRLANSPILGGRGVTNIPDAIL
jgi:HD-like signal output (HDOD) protein